ILIDRQGHAKVTDFGIATGADWTRVTRAGSIIGSARYMSPEQIRSKPVDARSDIYSLGVVMYEMIAGRPPFDGTNMPEIARHHLRTPPPSLAEIRPDLPAGLEKVIMRCLEKMPEDRFVSMDELIGALVGLGLYTPQAVPEVAPAERRARSGGVETERTWEERARAGRRPVARRRPARRRKFYFGTAALLAIVLLVVILSLALSGGDAPKV
ncbi:MAG: serine/threonine protein kinase, partial [Firmicutes bacterium]|nr:serine/threonine protein kinase [Bacillota bacterium]